MICSHLVAKCVPELHMFVQFTINRLWWCIISINFNHGWATKSRFLLVSSFFFNFIFPETKIVKIFHDIQFLCYESNSISYSTRFDWIETINRLHLDLNSFLVIKPSKYFDSFEEIVSDFVLIFIVLQWLIIVIGSSIKQIVAMLFEEIINLTQ